MVNREQVVSSGKAITVAGRIYFKFQFFNAQYSGFLGIEHFLVQGIR
jgi:hypothetical protein